MCIDEPGAGRAPAAPAVPARGDPARGRGPRPRRAAPTACARSSSPRRRSRRWRAIDDERRRQGRSRWRCSTRRWSSCAAASPRCRTAPARPRRSRAPAPRRSPACLQLLDVRRLLDHLEVDHALAEAVERVGADDRVQRDAGLARAGADLAHELALQRLLVELALAGDDGARGAHALVEVERVEDERRAGLERRAVGSPTGRRTGRRRRRSSGRRAGRAGNVCASSSRRCLEPRRPSPRRRPSAGRRPSARPRRRCGRRTARRSWPCRCRRRPRSPRARPAPPSVVAEPPTATRITAAPACAAAAISSPVP